MGTETVLTLIDCNRCRAVESGADVWLAHLHFGVLGTRGVGQAESKHRVQARLRARTMCHLRYDQSGRGCRETIASAERRPSALALLGRRDLASTFANGTLKGMGMPPGIVTQQRNWFIWAPPKADLRRTKGE